MTAIKNAAGWLGAGLESGFAKALKVLGYGVVSAVLGAAIDYLSNYRVSTEVGTAGALLLTYGINGGLVFLKTWLFTAQAQAAGTATVEVKTVVPVEEVQQV